MERKYKPSLFKVSEIELLYRNKVHPKDRIKVNNSDMAYDVFMSVWDMNKIELVEQFNILLLDRQNGCIGVSTVATGGTAACIVDPKMIFATALKAKASGIILAHNHPSGSLRPSEEDIRVTKRLLEGADLLDLFVSDHLIVSRYDYYSFTDEGKKASKSVRWEALAS